MYIAESLPNFTHLPHASPMAHKQGWLIPDLIPRNGLVVLAAAPKAGKTLLASHIARQLATGGELFGNALTQTPVYWAAHEESLEERLPFLNGITENDPFYIGWGRSLPFLDDKDCDFGTDRHGRYNPDAVPYVFESIAQAGSGLLVIDCLHAACRHTNLADNTAARRIMTRLRHWAHSHNTSVLLLHHVTKTYDRAYNAERIADSAQILAAASCHFYMEAKLQENGTRRIILLGAGRYPAPPHRIEILSRDPYHYELASTSDTPQRRPTVANRVLDLLSEGWELTATEIATRINSSPQVVRVALSDLRNRGVEPCDGPRKNIRYRLVQTPDEACI